MDGLKDRLHLFDSGPCFIFRFGGRSLASKIRPRHLRHFLKRCLKVAGRRKISDNDFTEFFLVIGEGGKAELPHEVAFKSGAGGISGLQRTHFFGEFIVSGLDLLRGTCEFSEIVFPVFGAGHFPNRTVGSSRGDSGRTSTGGSLDGSSCISSRNGFSSSSRWTVSTSSKRDSCNRRIACCRLWCHHQLL